MNRLRFSLFSLTSSIVAFASVSCELAKQSERNHNRNAVYQQVSIGENIYSVADRLEKNGWYFTGPFDNDPEENLRIFIKVGRHHISNLLEEMYGKDVPGGDSAYVIIEATPDGKIVSIE